MKSKLIIVVLMFFLASCTTQTASTKEDTLKVSGKASVKAIPEEVSINIPIRVTSKSFQSCSDELLSKIEKVIAGLKKIGFDVSLINTDNYSITENYEYNNGKRIKTGYVGSIKIVTQKKYAAKMVAEVIELLKNLQLTYSINFQLSEAQKTALSNASITQAIADAKIKAKAIADASNVKLERIASITYDASPVHDNLVRMYESNDLPAIKSTAIQFNPSEIEINKMVNIVWVIDN